jgi:hypothetical protein
MAGCVEIGGAYANAGGNLAGGVEQVATANAGADDSEANLAAIF